MYRFYVYELIDPRSDRPFYVGKGQKDRCYQHMQQARSGRAGAKCDMIREIEADGLEVGVRKFNRTNSEFEAFRDEERRIKELGIRTLTNLTMGGRGGRRRPKLTKPKVVDVEAVALDVVGSRGKIISRLIVEHLCGYGRFIGTMNMTKVGYDMSLRYKKDLGEERFFALLDKHPVKIQDTNTGTLFSVTARQMANGIR